jgi:flagellar motor switch protein FliG
MTREQIQTGNTLLSKALPDLKSVEHTKPEPELSREEIEERLQNILQANPTLAAELVELSKGKITPALLCVDQAK